MLLLLFALLRHPYSALFFRASLMQALITAVVGAFAFSLLDNYREAHVKRES